MTAILSAISDPAWIKDPLGVYLVLNAAAARGIGLPPAEIVGKSDYDLFAHEHAERLREADRQAMVSGFSRASMEPSGALETGQPGAVLRPTLHTPVFDPTGALVGVFGIAPAAANGTPGGTDAGAAAPDHLEQAREARMRQAEEELSRLRDRLQHGVSRQQWLQEEERKALARELGQRAAALIGELRLRLEAARRIASERNAEQALQAAVEAATAHDAAMKDIALRLHPLELEQLGLAGALRRQVTQRCADSAANIRFSENLGGERFAASLERGCFRVVEEALRNALRHAQARSIEISLARRGHHLWLSVQDDGVGFDVEPALADGSAHALGLLGMRERVHALGGDLDIDARPGAGTRVLASFPLTETLAERSCAY